MSVRLLYVKYQGVKFAAILNWLGIQSLTKSTRPKLKQSQPQPILTQVNQPRLRHERFLDAITAGSRKELLLERPLSSKDHDSFKLQKKMILNLLFISYFKFLVDFLLLFYRIICPQRA